MKSLFRYYRLEFKETLSLAFPIIIAQLGLVLMGVADTIMVGRVGAAQLAAAGVSNSVYFLIAVVGSGALSMVSPLVAGSRGHRNKIESPGNFLKASLLAGIWLALGTFLVMVLLAWKFEVFRQEPEVESLSRPYLLIIAASVFPMYYFWGAKQFTDGMGEVRISMLITLLGLVTNVILNWVLIFGHWGLPALGLNGAGIATLLSRILMAFLSHGAVFQSSRFMEYLKEARIRKRLVIKIFRLGLPSGMQYFFEVAAFSGAAIMAGWLGVASLAAHQIAINLASVTYMVAAGFSSAGAIRVGNARGRKSNAGVTKAGTTTLILSLGFMTLTALMFILFRSFWVGLYIEEAEVAGIATGLLIIAAFFQLSDGVQVAGLGILRGMYDVYIPTAITLVSYWVIGIPLGYYLSEYQGFGVSGIWYGLLAGLTCSALLLVWRFYVVCKFFPAAR